MGCEMDNNEEWNEFLAEIDKPSEWLVDLAESHSIEWKGRASSDVAADVDHALRAQTQTRLRQIVLLCKEYSISTKGASVEAIGLELLFRLIDDHRQDLGKPKRGKGRPLAWTREKYALFLIEILLLRESGQAGSTTKACNILASTRHCSYTGESLMRAHRRAKEYLANDPRYADLVKAVEAPKGGQK